MEPAFESLVGDTVLGEYRLTRRVTEDDGLAVFAALSTVDGLPYTVAVAKRVPVETSSMALEGAASRSGRHAVGIRALLPVVHARVLTVGESSLLAVVRRGEPGISLSDELAGERELPAVLRDLEPVASALDALHGQGISHGAVALGTVVRTGDHLALDLFGLASAAEAAAGTRGAGQILSAGARAPELVGALPTSPGPWTDVHGLALVALSLWKGASVTADPAGGPTPRTLGLSVPERVEALFTRALSAKIGDRPSPKQLLAGLREAANDPVPVAGPLPEMPPGPPSVDATERPLRAAAAPPPVASPRSPVVTTRRADVSSRLVGVSIGLGLAIFALGMGAAVTYVLARGEPPPPVPVSGGSLPATPPITGAPSTAPSPLMTSPTPRPTGPATYPDDQTSLVPVEADAPVWGDRDAPLTVVMFVDLTCPFTSRLLGNLPLLQGHYGRNLRIVLKHYPLPGHAEAFDGAEASAAALARGGTDVFFHFVEAARASASLDAGNLEQIGIRAGLPAGVITDALSRHAYRKTVERDVDLGRRLGVRGTPVLFYNGRRVDGLYPMEVLYKLLDAELRRARVELTKGTPPAKLYATRVTANVTTSEGEKPTSGP
jgi:protein-disulfide isomerase